MKLRVLQLLIIVTITSEVYNTPSHGAPRFVEYFCKGNEYISSVFGYYSSEGYSVYINKPLLTMTDIKLQLDSGSAIQFLDNSTRFSADTDTINNIFTFVLVKDVDNLMFVVRGRSAPNHSPYVISLKINGIENCREPNRTYFQKYTGVAKLFEKAPDKFCGRRRINRRYTELLVSGSATKAGDWPWHAALMRLQKSSMKYIGGGTLISKYVVLTAAHCATVNGIPVNPEIMNVILGKYTLVARDIALQEKEVFRVIVHDEFNHRTLNNDIALLKLTTEAIYNNYVQPACIWFDGIYDHLGSYDIKGTVVGWGFDNTDTLSTKLKSAAMPLLPDVTCIRFDPVFYSNFLNGKRFCAGNGNGTAACNGDSGGGFMVFVQDDLSHSYYLEDYIDGAWYVKGIVSVSLARSDASICDPNAYTIFTDVAVYRDWILNNI
ncbi:chymotrypsin-C-like isoform X3 [Maniola hyperantus]|uniref:chymotrypsin-C-like isoform X3 n=1 Tax=Aphantopus hyperantus TaxID=2795564 RepID=UPI0015687B66|nr:chymotrypsin-C-like isoform X1 [Maniola hyperantus]